MKFSTYRYVVFGILGLAYILVFFHRLSPAVVAVDMMRDLKAGGALMGILASAYFYPYALMQIPAGLLSDSWGPRRSVTFFLLFAVAGSIGLGLAQNAATAIIARVFVGLGVALVFVPTLKILTNWFASEDFVRMTGLLLSLGGVGAYFAATPLAMLSEVLSWRGSMIVIGVATLLIVALVWLLVRDTPQELGYAPLKGILSPAESQTTKSLLQGMGLVLKTPLFWPMSICFFLSGAVSMSFAGLWGGPFLVHVYDMSRAQTGAILSMMAIGLIIGAPTMSWLSDKVFRSRKKLLIVNLLWTFCMFLALAFFTADFPPLLLYFWCFFYSLGFSGIMVLGYALIKELFPMKIAGTATGLTNIFPFAGAAVGQPLMGWYLDSFGTTNGVYGVAAYSSSFKLCLIVILGAIIAAAMVKETFPAKKQ
jgi:sugar phosphate permease